jgi:ABC-2 type transport system ATP-binding protein
MAVDPTMSAPERDAGTSGIEVHGLRKRYGDRDALQGVDLEVARGAFFGMLGPNGAGKTTLVGILTTLLDPTEGSARLLGRDVVSERAAVRRSVGVVFQDSTLDPELTAREHLVLYARLYRLDAVKDRAAAMLARLDLADHADEPVRQLSGGMKRRLEIGRGVLHEPSLLFLDEPTTGLDVSARAAVWELLRGLHSSGETTLFLTTHSMEEADALCESLAIMDEGRIVATGSPETLKAALGGDVARLVVERSGDAASRLSAVEDVREVVEEARGDEVAFRVTVRDGPRRLPALLDSVRDLGVAEVTLHRPSLEDVFLYHTGARFEERDA